MKRLFLMAVAMLSMTMTYAENEETNNVNSVEAYDMSINMDQMSRTLGLTSDQRESFAEIHKTFCGEMMMAAQASKDERQAKINKAVKKDLAYMHYILGEEQYRKYVMLLNLTFYNRGLNK